MENQEGIPVPNKLRVVHYPQIPCNPFIVEVSNEKEASLIVQTLANQHLFLLKNNIIPDYCNAIEVEMLDDEDDWTSYWNEQEGMEWDEFEETYLTK